MTARVQINDAQEGVVNGGLTFTNDRKHLEKIQDNEEFFNDMYTLYQTFLKHVENIGKKHNMGVTAEAVLTINKLKLQKE